MNKHLLPFAILSLFATQTKAQLCYADACGYVDTVHFINFSSATQFIRIDTSLHANIWEIGSPHKSVIDSAHSLARAIMTDTANVYPVNNYSAFYLTIDSAVLYKSNDYFKESFISFWHKYDMQSPGDYGLIEVSYDKGASWGLLSDTSYTDSIGGRPMFNWGSDYNPVAQTYSQHADTITGSSNGWINSSFCFIWTCCPVMERSIPQWNDTLLLRFSFTSGSTQHNKDGWIIDDIAMGSYDLCGGVKEKESGDVFSITPNPVANLLTIHASSFHAEAVTTTILNVLGQVTSPPAPLLQDRGAALVDVSKLSPGIYFLQIKTGQRRVVKKFVKQ